MIKHDLFTGSGMSSIRNVFDLYRPGGRYFETDHLHNDLIEIFAESGVFAFGAFMVFVFTALRGLLAQKNAPARIIFTSAAALLIHSLFNFPFYIIDTRFYFFALLGAGLPAGESEKPGRDTVLFSLAAASAMLVVLNALCGSVYLNYAINYSREKKDATPMLVQAVKLYPGAKKYYYAADWLFEQGNAKGALEYSQKFIEAMPTSKTGCIQAGILAAESGDPGKATGFFNAFLRKYPDDEDVLNNLGKVKYMMGRSSEAVEIFRRILSKHPDNRLAHDSLMTVYANTGMKAEAEIELKRWEGLQK
jgi:tetratricopeptide (TPR) repeat protein